MKKTEREKILKTYRLLNEEIEKAEKIVNEASDYCAKRNYSNNSYQYYQQRYEYLKDSWYILIKCFPEKNWTL